jgi:hypothetical protein
MAARFAVAWVGISLLVLFMAAIPAACAGVSAASDFTLGGYIQSRLILQKDANPGSSFTDSRVYITGTAVTGADTKVGFFYSGFSVDSSGQSVNKGGLLMAWGEKTKGNDTYRMGLYKSPFGYETGLSSASLVTLERSKAVSELVYKPWSFDNGFYWDRTDGSTTISAAVTNGEPMQNALPVNRDSDNVKNFTARIGSTKAKSVCGASAMYGDSGDLTIYGLDGRTTGTDINLIGEAVYADDHGVKKDGFYLTAACNKANQTYHPYARLDWYDSDADTSDNEYTGFTIGVSRNVNTMTKETIEISNGQQKTAIEPASGSGSQSWKATYQWQGKF